MRIRKVSQSIPIKAKVVNSYSESEEETYSCDYMNEHSIVVSPTEPTGNDRRKVWFQKGKNLFNKNVSIITGYYLDNEGSLVSNEGSWYQNVFIEVNSKTQYTISSTVAVLRICFYDKDRKFISRVATENTSVTFSTPENCKYVRLSGDNADTQVQSLQLEQGSKATSYEAYIEPQIYVRNSNGMYEEFIEKKIKYGSVENPDSSKFQITYSRIVQVDNTVYVDIRIKILTEIPANQQYSFNISGVTPPKSAIYPLASYGVNEYNFRASIYCYMGKGPCVLNNPGMSSAVNGFWKVHFSYNAD